MCRQVSGLHWDNGKFKLFPNVMTEFKTRTNQFSFQLGWTGYMRNAGFQYPGGDKSLDLEPGYRLQHQDRRKIPGLKGTLGDHFSYSGKLAYNLINEPTAFPE